MYLQESFFGQLLEKQYIYVQIEAKQTLLIQFFSSNFVAEEKKKKYCRLDWRLEITLYLEKPAKSSHLVQLCQESCEIFNET